MKIVSEKNNPLLKRLELDFEIRQKTTPSRKEVVEALSEAKKVKKELIIVGHFAPIYGAEKLAGKAHVYESEAVMKKTEPGYILERHFGKKEKKPEEKKEAPKEAKKEEKPKQEKKPEAKEEKKPADEKKGEK